MDKVAFHGKPADEDQRFEGEQTGKKTASDGKSKQDDDVGQNPGGVPFHPFRPGMPKGDKPEEQGAGFKERKERRILLTAAELLRIRAKEEPQNHAAKVDANP